MSVVKREERRSGRKRRIKMRTIQCKVGLYTHKKKKKGKADREMGVERMGTQDSAGWEGVFSLGCTCG